ncbi:MAG: hypothetical protein H7829_14415 [Magnetococcus sp. THC-1_WYH]
MKLLKEKRGLGDCPQGFDFDFDFKQKGFHVPFLNLFLILFKFKNEKGSFLFKVKTLGKEFPRPLLFFQ